MFKKFTCDFSIRARLKIFLLLPWLVILCFGINQALDYIEDINQARQVSLSIEVSSEIDKLIYQLQKERGLTAGITSKKNKLGLSQLQSQRQQTDISVGNFFELAKRIELKQLNLNSVANPEVTALVLEDTLAIINELPSKRKEINLNSNRSYFDYYSRLIKQLLRLISIAQVQFNNAEQNRTSVDYLNLLYLQEKSGKERGALNALLNTEQLQPHKLQQVIYYGNEQAKILDNLFSVSKSPHQQWLNTQLNSQTNQQVLMVRASLKDQLTRIEQVATLEREIGFGGLIHNFKNYILRGEQNYLDGFLKHLLISKSKIKELKQLRHLTDSEKQAIATITNMLSRYHQHILLAKLLREQGNNVEKIDLNVRIDDSQAIAAIKVLQGYKFTINANFWWELASQRIALFREISEHIRSDIQKSANQEEKKSIERLILYINFFVMFFIVMLYFSFLVVNRIINKIKFISKAMATMQLEHKFNQPLSIKGNDEITDMVKAFNQMLAERGKSEGEQRISAAVFKYASEAIMITNANNEIETVNPAFCNISGYKAEDVLGKTPAILSSGKHDSHFYKQMWQALEKNSCWQGEVWNKRKSGEIYPEFLSISVVRDKNKKPIQYISLFSDITKHKKFEEDIWIQANYDSLTGLPNRHLCLERLSNELGSLKVHSHEVALLFIDLDRFKNVNDTWGHNSGDELLKLAAIRLNNCIREKDTVARFGGDEFVVLLVGLPNRFAIERIVKSILLSLSNPFNLSGNHEAVVSASIGVTVGPSDGDNVGLLLKNADTAMYQAKAAGRNTYQFFTSCMNESVSQRMHIEQALRQAIKLQEFVLYYQPVVSLETGDIIGAEALIRWQHPNKGLIYPDSFINIAEETGLIEAIGQWVIEQACADLKHWHEQGLAIQVAVNVSSRQCRQGCQKPIIDVLSNALKVNNVKPSYLKVEITESLLMDNSQEMITTLQGIRNLGVSIHMDDFGTGYSSLSYLKHFPIDVLKIDRSFIDGAVEDKTDASLVEAVVRIGHSLSLKLVGEGIETQQHYDYLRSLGCDYGQGYLISKPIPVTAFIAFCQSNDNQFNCKNKATAVIT